MPSGKRMFSRSGLNYREKIILFATPIEQNDYDRNHAGILYSSDPFELH